MTLTMPEAMTQPIEILEVARYHPDRDHLLIGWIETPRVGERTNGQTLSIDGWAFSREGAKAVMVECGIPGLTLGAAPITVARPDIAAHHPAEAAALTCGFGMEVSLLGLPRHFTIYLTVIFEDGGREFFGRIRGERTPLVAPTQSAYTPVMVTCLGRSGTTPLLQMLADHPEIVVQRIYPYETRQASYWMHLLGVLAAAGREMKAQDWTPYFSNPHIVHGNPFSHRRYANPDAVRDWFGMDYVRRLAAFCQENIETFYDQVRETQGEATARCYAEKVYPNRVPDLLWEVNPRTREIFSVRDCRDMLCSIVGFVGSKSRNFLRYTKIEDVEAFIPELRDDLTRLLASWRRRSSRAHLVRYEDLILHPAETCRAICTYLGVDAAPATIETMIQRTFTDTVDYLAHRTSANLAASIGRWREELSPELKGLCAEAFGGILADFGYE